MIEHVCRVFQQLAHLSFVRISEAQASGLNWSEETNTETLLLTIRRRLARYVHVHSFSKKKEALNGSDWEWWFVNDQLYQVLKSRTHGPICASRLT